VSKVLVSYGQHMLNVQQVSDPYNDKYKGIWICLQVRVLQMRILRFCR
jgi:hypothetical protein